MAPSPPLRRVPFRPPGVRPWTRIGPLGPFRGRLGLQWVIAPLVLGLLLVSFAWLLLFRTSAPGGSFRPVGAVGSFPKGSARAVGVPGMLVGSAGGRLFAVRARPGCAVSYRDGHYVDCRGVAYALEGQALGGPGRLDLLPLTIYRGVVYVDTGDVRGGAPGRGDGEPAATVPGP